MKKIFLGLSLIALSVFARAQQGLENIIVEKYYISDANDAAGATGFGDALPAGSTTYRVYVDMLPGYKFQAAYGTQDVSQIPLHTLKLMTSTTFYNNTDRGHEIPSFSKTNAAQHTTMLDSYFSAGAACATGAGPVYNYGILKADDGAAGGTNVVNAHAILQNNDPAAGIPLTTADGIYGVSSPVVSGVTFVNMAQPQSDFDGGPSSGSFISSNSSWASLNGATAPTADNRVLIGQFTTNGCFYFELNIQIGTPTGGVQKYVARNATGNEILFPACTYPLNAANLPAISIAPSPVVPVCPGSTVTFAATIANGGGSPVYQWKKNGVNDGTNNAAYTTLLAANDQVTCELTSSITCPNANPVTSNTLSATPPAVSFPLNLTYGADAVVTLGGSPAGGTFSGPGVSGNTFTAATAGVGGPYTISYSYTDPVSGCSNSVSHTTTVNATYRGPSSSATAYVLPVASGATTKSILTVPDLVGSYEMEGLPDGLGAFDNGNGTFTLLMNHELGNTVGAVRAHGSLGSFVSKWIINKTTLAVQSGSDLMQNVNLWNTATSTYTTYNSGNPNVLARFGRFCSADLPAVSALYNSGTGMGTQERIFMNGEETSDESRQMAHIVTGANAGTSWELPALGKAAWENSVANPVEQNKTIVAELNDGTDGQVYIYIGTKTNTGTEIQKAGLTNGHPFGVKVTGFPVERVNTSTINNPPAAGTHFDLVDIGDVTNITGATFNTNSNTLGITKFSRPEDGSWDPNHPDDFYFVTTDQYDQVSDFVGTQVGRTRLWKLHFTDIYNPESGGTIEALLDGTEGLNMLDNIGFDHYGHILMQEDVGNQQHNGKIWQYTIATDALVQVARHDAERFGDIGAPATFPFNQDEETSGIIDVQEILGPGMFITADQAHYSISGAAVEGGQLLRLFNQDTYNSSLCATTSTTTINACVSYAWNGHTYTASGTYNFHTSNAAGCDSSATLVLTINPLPAVSFTTLAGSYQVNAAPVTLSGSPAGGTFSGPGISGNTFNPSVAGIGGPYTITYSYDGGNGCANTSSQQTTVIQCTAPDAGVISGKFAGVCSGTTRIYSVINVAGITYNWTAPANASIISGQGTHSLKVVFLTGFTTGTISINASNVCGTGPVSAKVIKSVPNIPGIITGDNIGLCGLTNVPYSVPEVSGYAYFWSVTPGAVITSGQYTNSITVDFTASGLIDTVRVVATNSCGASPERTKIVKMIPKTAQAITGNNMVTSCLNEAYSINPIIGASSYLWTVPSGSSVVSGQGTTNIVVDFGNNSGNVTVKGVNSCGSGVRSVLTVSVSGCARLDGNNGSITKDVKVYPNPTSGKINLEYKSAVAENYNLQVFDLADRLLISEHGSFTEGANFVESDFSALAKGVYVLKINSASVNSEQRIVVQ